MYGRSEGPYRSHPAPLGDAEIQRLADRAEQGYEPHELRERDRGDELRFRNLGDEIRHQRQAEVARLIEAGRAQLGDEEADRMQAELAERAAELDTLE